MNQEIYDYLKEKEKFENQFPGYESTIHGVERENKNGKMLFKILCIKKWSVS